MLELERKGLVYCETRNEEKGSEGREKLLHHTEWPKKRDGAFISDLCFPDYIFTTSNMNM